MSFRMSSFQASPLLVRFKFGAEKANLAGELAGKNNGSLFHRSRRQGG